MACNDAAVKGPIFNRFRLLPCIDAQHISALSALVGSLGLQIPLSLERTCSHRLVLLWGI